MFNCTRCSFLGKSKVQLEIHIEKNHRKNLYKCEKCGCTTKSEWYYLRHNTRCQEDKTLICEYCPYKVTNEVFGRNKMKLHIEIKHEGVIHACHLCGAKLTRKCNLDKHMQEKHSSQTFKCSFCNYIASCKRNITRHLNRVHDEKKFKCNLCEFKAGYPWGITRHKLVSHQDNLSNTLEKYKCQSCDYLAKRSDGLKLHMTRVHLEGKKPRPSQTYLRKLSHLVSMKCKLCGLEATKGGFRKHLFLMHKIDKRTEDDNLVNYERCSDCNTIPRTKGRYKNHLYWKHSSDDVSRVYPPSPKRKKIKNSMGTLQDKRFKEEVSNPVLDDEEVVDIISEDEGESIEIIDKEVKNKVLYGEYYESNDSGQIIKDETKEDITDGINDFDKQEKNKQYLCPISFCTFSLLGKNEISEQNHLKSNHPCVKNKTSFLVL